MNKIALELTDKEAACFYGIVEKEVAEWELLMKEHGEGGDFYNALAKVLATKPAHIVTK